MNIKNYDNRRTKVALEAIELINGDRQATYGPPSENLARLADRWSQRLNRSLAPSEAALMLVDLKLSRLMHSADEDGYRDAIGYLAIAAELAEQEQ